MTELVNKPVIIPSDKTGNKKTLQFNNSAIEKYLPTFGNYRQGYNLIKNNCADALIVSLGLKTKPYKSLGVTIPGNVYKGIIENFGDYDINFCIK